MISRRFTIPLAEGQNENHIGPEHSNKSCQTLSAALTVAGFAATCRTYIRSDQVGSGLPASQGKANSPFAQAE